MNATKRKWDVEEEPQEHEQRTFDGPTFSEDEDEDFSDEDVSWENLALDENILNQSEARSKIGADSDVLDIRLSGSKKDKSSNPAMTALARKIRFETHKLHLLCLMYHGSLRNKWLSDSRVRDSLKRTVQNFKGNVKPPVKASQYQRTRILTEGLKSALEYWHDLYKVVKRGLYKPQWSDKADSTIKSANASKTALLFADFCRAAASLKGDRDVGAQLFTLFLRMLGLEARLICSLQPVSFRSNKSNFVALSVSNSRAPSVERPMSESSPTKSLPISRPRKLTKPSFNAVPSATRLASSAVVKSVVEKVEESSYPIYWTEVFDPAAQKWVPVDAMVTQSVGKTTKFEPPLSSLENTLSYVVGFDADNSAKDVTMRYTKQFNAKVRNMRVTSLPSGDAWWKRIMRFYRSPYREDRDQIEQAEFAQIELREGIPKNVSDLKNHPIFVIERHLHRNQIIHPMVECGSIVVSRSRSPEVEKVYARKNVRTLRSSLAWYMRGRRVCDGEQPLKLVQKRKVVAEAADEPLEQEPLFADFQTEEYIPPPVQDGAVPKNAYGNIDVFSEQMVPPGGVHLLVPNGKRIAQFMGIDFAEAVTGFDHRNRQIVPLIKGIVIAQENEEGFKVVYEAFTEQEGEEARQKRSLAALKRWTHFIKGLMIRRRIYNEFGDQERPAETFEEGISEFAQERESVDEDTGGGFMAE